MAGKFTIKSRTWNIITVVGIVVLLIIGIGGLFYIQGSIRPNNTTMLWFLVGLGIVTFLMFAGPGLLYPGRKRVGWIKKILPGGTMPWIRAHMYLPALAIAAALVHAFAAPFRDNLSSGKILFAVGILVVISGFFRHHMIGLQKEALNVNVEITKLTTGQPKQFRDLVTDYLENRRPLPEIEAEVGKLDRPQQVLWGEVMRLSERVERNFPRTGGQTTRVIHYKMWKAIHPPLTFALFIILAFHVWDVVGAKQRIFHEQHKQFASAQQCAGCHSDVFADWSISTMSHGITSTITRGQLPVTLNKNKQIADAKGGAQKDLFVAAAQVCVVCHSPAGAQFSGKQALLPLNEPKSADLTSNGVAVSGGNDAVVKDGVGCISCHTMENPPAKLAGADPKTIRPGKEQKPSDYGTFYGPLFSNPNAIPVRVHGIEQGADNFWSDPIKSSQVCGACHDVKLDTNGNKTTSANANAPDTFLDGTGKDSNGNSILDQNELDFDQAGKLQDLVLQTTYDEWQDYIAAFDKRIKGRQSPAGNSNTPQGCGSCHMPTKADNPLVAVVDHAPGFLGLPKRLYRSHTFAGVDYDMDLSLYQGKGLPSNGLEKVLAERQALVQSAVTLQVTNQGKVAPGVFRADVTVANNLLGHGFPTGFAFARQFWLEVSAVDTKTGQPVCLAAAAPNLPAGNCASGVIQRPDDVLPQCDIKAAQAALAANPVLTLKGDGALNAKVDPNNFFVTDKGVVLAAPLPVGQCDPWLADFAKILTDGDANGQGVFKEVQFQAFLPDIVKLRTRVATGQVMAPLDPTREKIVGNQLVDQSQTVLPYAFDIKNVPDGDLGSIVVTAKMHLRHIPPEFVKGLEAEQKLLNGQLPDGAKINADALLKNMFVDDGTNKHPVAENVSGQPAKTLCPGPQNDSSATIQKCADAYLPDIIAAHEQALGKGHTVNTVTAAYRPGSGSGGLAADLERWPLWLAVLGAFGAASALLRRRLLHR